MTRKVKKENIVVVSVLVCILSVMSSINVYADA